MIDPAKVLETADRLVEQQDRFAAGPSHDVAIHAAVVAFAAHANAEIAQLATGFIALLAALPDVLNGEREVSAFKHDLHEFAKSVGIAP